MVKEITPDDVAEEIVDALRTGRIDVWVPRSLGRINRTPSTFLPSDSTVASGQEVERALGWAHSEVASPNGVQGQTE